VSEPYYTLLSCLIEKINENPESNNQTLVEQGNGLETEVVDMSMTFIEYEEELESLKVEKTSFYSEKVH